MESNVFVVRDILICVVYFVSAVWVFSVNLFSATPLSGRGCWLGKW